MNKLLLFLGICMSLLLCSCSDFENEVWINEDGSGKMTMNYDMSPMLAMAAMAEGFEEAADPYGTEENVQEEIEKSMESEQDILSLLEDLKDPTTMRDIDTSFYFYDVMPDSVKQKSKNPDLFKKVKFSLESNKKESKAIMGLEFDYDNIEDLKQIYREMELLSDKPGAGGSPADGMKELVRTYDVDLKNGILTFPEQDFEGELGDSMQDSEMDFESMDEEGLAMMKMMLGDAGVSVKVHLPGEVTSCDDPAATIESNTVYFKDSFFDLMEAKKLKGRVIKFK